MTGFVIDPYPLDGYILLDAEQEGIMFHCVTHMTGVWCPVERTDDNMTVRPRPHSLRHDCTATSVQCGQHVPYQ